LQKIAENTYRSASPKETQAFGAALWRALAPGSVVALYGAMGAGKTVLAQGFARALGTGAAVTSPTYTLLHIYEGARGMLYHFDLYRLESPEQVPDIGFWDYAGAVDGVTLIEWPQRLGEELPADRLDVHIEKEGENIRVFRLEPAGAQTLGEIAL
jgi:tRNA threonylcarbamoyladenosine biosynthesis protein TsaE